MAVARQIQVHAEEDGVVAVQRDVIVDPELGIVAEVEKVVAAVDVGGGKIAVREENRVKVIRAIPTQAEQRPAISAGPARSAPQQPKPPPPVTTTAATARAATTSSWSPPLRNRLSRTICRKSSSLENLDKYCIKTRIVWVCSIALFIVGSALVGLAAYFLLPCAPLEKAGVSIIIIGCLTLVITCIYCTNLRNKRGQWAVFRYVCIGLLLLVFFSAAVATSAFVFDDYDSTKESADDSDDCHNITAVLATVMASVSYGILVMAFGFCCLHTIASCNDD